MHFSVLVTVDGSVKEADLESAVEKLLEPYNENTEVPEYAIDPAVHKYHDTWDKVLTSAKKYVANHPDDVDVDADKLTDLQLVNWYSASDPDGGPWTEDGNGGFVEMSTYNPLSKWDYWTIGGRWAEYLNQIPNGTEEHPVWGKYTVYRDGKNYLRRRDLRSPQSTNSHVTKTGEWHQKPSPDVDWSDREAATARFDEVQKEWDKTQAEYLLSVPGEDWLVIVDIHI